MKYIEEYRKPGLQKKIILAIKDLSLLIDKKINLMEVCGTHTMAIGKYGIRKILPENIKLISGPGCPVCVTSISYIDTAIKLSKRKDVIIATFGDMMKVPGSFSTLEKERANGGQIFVCYSPYDSIEIARTNNDKKIIFLAVGFETTAPLIAQTIKIAEKNGLNNFFILSGNKLIPPVLEFLLKEKDTEIDGFICPGHVSVIIGSQAYRFISERFNIPCVISGFEPFDILYSIYLILQSIINNRPNVINEYTRAVKYSGNIKAKELIYQVFDVCDSEWRGIGIVKNSGLKLKKEYFKFDAYEKFNIKIENDKKEKCCLCGEILKGKKTPFDCPLFGKKCNPENPFGPCMVSSEGTCSAYYKYERK